MARQMVIVRDTREQKPFQFKGVPSVTSKLDVGDYSLKGLESKIAVERKALSDMWATVAVKQNMERFSRELDRARDLGIPLWIVVEASVLTALGQNAYTGMSPFRLMDRLHMLCFRHGASVSFAGGRKEAEIVTLSILRGAWADMVDATAVV